MLPILCAPLSAVVFILRLRTPVLVALCVLAFKGDLGYELFCIWLIGYQVVVEVLSYVKPFIARRLYRRYAKEKVDVSIKSQIFGVLTMTVLIFLYAYDIFAAWWIVLVPIPFLLVRSEIYVASLSRLSEMVLLGTFVGTMLLSGHLDPSLVIGIFLLRYWVKAAWSCYKVLGL